MTGRPHLRLLIGVDPLAWQDRAECRGVNPDLFFPESKADLKVALRLIGPICAACPVQAECLEYGRSQHFGIWGGEYVGPRFRPDTSIGGHWKAVRVSDLSVRCSECRRAMRPGESFMELVDGRCICQEPCLS